MSGPVGVLMGLAAGLSIPCVLNGRMKTLAGQQIRPWKGGVSPGLAKRFDRVALLLNGDAHRYWNLSKSPDLQPLFWIVRPESELVRCVARVEDQEFHCYIKFHRAYDRAPADRERALNRMREEASVTREVFARFRGNPSYSVPQTYAFFPEELAMVTKELPGRRLLDVLREKATGFTSKKIMDELVAHLQRVGGWLREFQRLNDGKLPESQDPAGHLMPYMTLRLEKLLKTGWLATSDVTRIKVFVAAQERALLGEFPRACRVHGDLSLSNVLVTPHSVGVLDFAMAGVSNVYEDLTYFFQRLDNLRVNPLFRDSTIRSLQHAFLAGSGDASIVEQPLFKAYQVRHIVNHLVDLSRSDGLNPLKRSYQHWQYRQRLSQLQDLIHQS